MGREGKEIRNTGEEGWGAEGGREGGLAGWLAGLRELGAWRDGIRTIIMRTTTTTAVLTAPDGRQQRR